MRSNRDGGNGFFGTGFGAAAKLWWPGNDHGGDNSNGVFVYTVFGIES